MNDHALGLHGLFDSTEQIYQISWVICGPPWSKKCDWEKPYSIIVILGKVDLGYLTLRLES